MMNIEPNASHTPDVLRDVLGEIETLRNIRQEEVRDRPHPFLKRFTQQELTDEACPTYKNLLVGRSQRIPSRQTLMQIADYLVGAPAASLHIAQQINNNQFTIAGGPPGLKVCWQVTGIRQDAWANVHRIPVEEDKPDEDQGYYIHPEAYGAPIERSVAVLREIRVPEAPTSPTMQSKATSPVATGRDPQLRSRRRPSSRKSRADH
jgi:hypothetical protein